MIKLNKSSNLVKGLSSTYKGLLFSFLFVMSFSLTYMSNFSKAANVVVPIDTSVNSSAAEKIIIENFMDAASGYVDNFIVNDSQVMDPSFNGTPVVIQTVGNYNPPTEKQDVFVSKLNLPSIPACSVGDPVLNINSSVTLAGVLGNGGTPAIGVLKISDGSVLNAAVGPQGNGTSTLTINNLTIPRADYDAGDIGVYWISTETADNGSLDYTWFNSSASITYDNSVCPINNAPTIDSNLNTTLVQPNTIGQLIYTGSSFNANDIDGDSLTYSIFPTGNEYNYFTIDPVTGNITANVANIPAGVYMLNVQVEDGNGGVAGSYITITVSQSNEIKILPKSGASR